MKYSANSAPFESYIKDQAGRASNLTPKIQGVDFVDFEQIGIIAADKEVVKGCPEGYTQDQFKGKVMARIKGSMKDLRRKHLGRDFQKNNIQDTISTDDEMDGTTLKLLDMLTYDEEQAERQKLLMDNITPNQMREICSPNDFSYVQQMQAGLGVEYIAEMYNVDTAAVLNAWHSLVKEVYRNPDMIASLRARVGDSAKGAEVLSSRELQILQYICSGKTSKETSFDLNISVRTVDNHRTNITKKLQISNLALLTRWAIKNGVIEL